MCCWWWWWGGGTLGRAHSARQAASLRCFAEVPTSGGAGRGLAHSQGEHRTSALVRHGCDIIRILNEDARWWLATCGSTVKTLPVLQPPPHTHTRTPTQTVESPPNRHRRPVAHRGPPAPHSMSLWASTCVRCVGYPPPPPPTHPDPPRTHTPRCAHPPAGPHIKGVLVRVHRKHHRDDPRHLQLPRQVLEQLERKGATRGDARQVDRQVLPTEEGWECVWGVECKGVGVGWGLIEAPPRAVRQSGRGAGPEARTGGAPPFHHCNTKQTD